MGVPVTDEIVCRAKRPSVDDIFPYLFKDNQAQYIERNNNCITISEWQEREGTLKQAATASVPTISVEIITAQTHESPFKLLNGLLMWQVCTRSFPKVMRQVRTEY
jgi:hypothetical protein